MSRFRVLGLLAAPVSALALLSGCAGGTYFGGDGNDVSAVQSARARHLIVGDEPFAVRTAAQVLAQGGSAADAAAAMFFARSVTYPVSAGLGGGGICIVRDAAVKDNYRMQTVIMAIVQSAPFVMRRTPEK